MSFLKLSKNSLYDPILLWLVLGLSCVGFIVVASSSMFTGMKLVNDPLFFLKREALYYIILFLFGNVLVFFLLSITIVMLLIIPIFGISINGASRWIVCGIFYIQPSELSKLTYFCYLSNYLDKITRINLNFFDICKPVIITIILLLLLLMQPDFGSVIIFIFTILSVLYITGVVYWKFLSLFFIVVLFLFLLIIGEPYRIQRIVSFLDPWKDPFGGGYQLIQSLVAFGRGAFFGQGLGNSIQKFEYLPEAHTDFIFAILAEELGFLGVLVVLLMIMLIIFKGMLISYKAFSMGHFFSAFLSSSIIFCFSFQVLINIGTVTGVLPTKGSTLPFISYGGSSFLIIVISTIILIRIDFELRFIHNQAFIKGIY